MAWHVGHQLTSLLSFLLLFNVMVIIVNCDCDEKSKKIEGDKTKYIAWFKECIAQKYGFVSDVGEKLWTKVPTLEKELSKSDFKNAALVAEKFFLNGGKPRKWNEVNELWLPAERCTNMLYVTAARYIYYTYALVEQSNKLDKKFGMCERSEDQVKPGEKKKYVLPEFSCYPENEGSKRCSSDADVGLVGPGSGKLVAKYNSFFKEKFGMSPEELFDNNVYAFSIEMAMPEVFTAAPGKEDEYEKVKTKLKEMDDDKHYQMQDLVFSYYKVYMYRRREADEFFLFIEKTGLNDDYQKHFDIWYDYLKNTLKQEKPKEAVDDKDFSNNMYSWLVNIIGDQKGLDTKMSFLLMSHVYASEAYLSRGALRVVVGTQQMKRESVKERLTPLDHWCTMIENYGDTMKEFKRECKDSNVGKCLMKLAKYLWRTFFSAEQLFKSLKNNNIGKFDDTAMEQDESKKLQEVMDMFGKENEVRPTDILKHWINDLKDKGIKEIETGDYDPKDKYASSDTKVVGKKAWVQEFLEKIGCEKKNAFNDKCMEQISKLIRVFNARMIKLTNAGKVAKQNCIGQSC